MLKHTPGPWILGDENDQHAQVCLGESNCSVDLRRFADYPNCPGMSREEMLANAKLICAAPEMLEVLVQIKGWAHNPSGPFSWEIMERLDEVVKRFRE